MFLEIDFEAMGTAKIHFGTTLGPLFLMKLHVPDLLVCGDSLEDLPWPVADTAMGTRKAF